MQLNFKRATAEYCNQVVLKVQNPPVDTTAFKTLSITSYLVIPGMAITQHYYTRFEEHKLYHIYNRTVDRKSMFASDDNYRFFLQRYDHYLSPVLDTFAYCLLGNHFHLLVRVKDLAPATISTLQELTNLPRAGTPHAGNAPHTTDLTTLRELSNLTRADKSGEKSTHDIVSHQFRKFFQSYAMAFNKQHGRIGTLFQTPFKRAAVNNERYFRNLICYIHHNPQQHRLIDDFRKWPWSSYGRMLTDSNSKLCKQEVLTWFGGKEEYTAFHNDSLHCREIDDLLIEDE